MIGVELHPVSLRNVRILRGKLNFLSTWWLRDLRTMSDYEWQVWDCSLEPFKSLLLQRLLASTCKRIWENFLFETTLMSMWAGPVHTGECIVSVRPGIGQEVGRRCPPQEFDSWRQSSPAQTSCNLCSLHDCSALRFYKLQGQKIMEMWYKIITR